MAELKFKHFSHSIINATLQNIAVECSRGDGRSAYIEFDKSRYIRVNAVVKCLFKGLFWHSDKISTFLSLDYTRRFKLIYQLIFQPKVFFLSDAEVVQIRNHLSVFYLDLEIRVKCFVKGGVRLENDLLNEWDIRNNILLEHPTLRAPRLIKLVNNANITCYLDEIVLGQAVNWADKKSERVLDSLLDSIFSYYIKSGISWRGFNEIHPNLTEALLDSIDSGDSNDFPDKDIVFKNILCSSIHGDLSLGNVIANDRGNYIIDWELSRQGSVIQDLFKIMKNKPVFSSKIERFFLEQARNIPKDALPSHATFAEHLALESFVDNA